MTKGTKIFLAVFALLVGVMVVYYGLMLPEPQLPPALTVSANNTVATPPQPLPVDVSNPPAASTPVTSPAPTADEIVDPGLLTQSVHSAANGDVTPISNPPLNLPESSSPVSTSGVASEPTPASTAEKPTVPLANVPVTISTVQPVPAQPQNPPTASPPPSAPSNPPNAPTASKATSTEYTVQSGDTMSSIAEDWFGDPSKWSLIARENPLVDPNRLSVGQKIRLPSKDAKPAPVKEVTNPTDSQFTVRSGDTLAKIAREYYNDVAKWKQIYELNKALIGSDPANLKPGMKLKLPPPSKPAT